MAFPSSVISDLVSGIPGEIAFDAPYTGITAIVDTTTEANNVFGRAFTYKTESVESVQAGGTGLFAGMDIGAELLGKEGLGIGFCNGRRKLRVG